MSKGPIFIPTFISTVDYQPARVSPRVYFYNGLKSCDEYYAEGYTSTTGSVASSSLGSFPHFDHYKGTTSTLESDSLLFNNEESAYGVVPKDSLYTKYWETYVELLYNPATRLTIVSAVIPVEKYYTLELNDVVNFRGNYYHLRAINDYNLTTGECNLQLLGPIIPDTFFRPEPANLTDYDDIDLLDYNDIQLLEYS